MFEIKKPYIENWSKNEIEYLDSIGEYFASGFLNGNDNPVVIRVAKGIQKHLEKNILPEYKGTSLYPSGRANFWDGSLMRYYYIGLRLDRDGIDELVKKTNGKEEKILLKYKKFASNYPDTEGWTHSIPNYGRVLGEGLFKFKKRIELSKEKYINDEEKQINLEAFSIALAAVENFINRIASYLESLSFDNEEKENNRTRLVNVFKHSFSKPAVSFKEAMIITNFVFFLDGPDDIGRFDQFMEAYYLFSKKHLELTNEIAIDWISKLWSNVDKNDSWNTTIGGSAPDRKNAINELTVLALKAAKGRRRPNLAMRIRKDTSHEVWEEVFDCIIGGTGIPAIYCEENYIKSLEKAKLNICEKDLLNFAFGGCTETMVHGCSNVGSLDENFNSLKIFETTLYTKLEKSETFNDFLLEYKKDIDREIKNLVDKVNYMQELKSVYHPMPIRSILIDDCIDKGMEFTEGGARCNWSVNNIMGLGNVIDSLIAIKKIIYEKQEMSSSQLLSDLKNNFELNPVLKKRLLSFDKFGNGIKEVDDLAYDISSYIFKGLFKFSPWRGGRFLGSCLMFTTYAIHGEEIGATPDGRGKAEPIADSAGAVQGRDKKGPTALLNSVSKIDIINAPGTLVVNIRLAKKMLTDKESRQKIKALIQGYFDMGGMQIQINVVDQKVLQDAMIHPENHGDLIIRVGGYSEYFNSLSDELKMSILERTEHEA